MSHPITALSPEVRALADALLSTPVGMDITHNDLSAAVGFDVRTRRYLILRAIAVASREAGAIYSAVIGVGYRRLSADEAAQLGEHARKRIRSASGRVSKMIIRATEVANDMDPEARRNAMREVSVLGLLKHIATDKASRDMPAPEKPQPVAITMRNMLTSMGGTR